MAKKKVKKNSANQQRHPPNDLNLVNDTPEAATSNQTETLLAAEADLAWAIEMDVIAVFLQAQAAAAAEGRSTMNLESLESSGGSSIEYDRDLLKRGYDGTAREVRLLRESLREAEERERVSRERSRVETEERERLIEELKAEKEELKRAERSNGEVKNKEKRVRELVEQHIGFPKMFTAEIKLMEEQFEEDKERIIEEKQNQFDSEVESVRYDTKKADLEMLEKTALKVSTSRPRGCAKMGIHGKYTALLEVIEGAFEAQRRDSEEVRNENAALQRSETAARRGESFWTWVSLVTIALFLLLLFGVVRFWFLVYNPS